MFADGYSNNGKFAFKMFNFGSGWGNFAVFPTPSKVTVIQNKGALINVGSSSSVWPSALISTPDATFATILVEYDSIPSSISYSCDDYCMISKPTNVLGITNWDCPDTFVDADGIKSAQGKCKKDYSYYKYECTKDTNGYDRPWVGPVVNNGEDCNANCGANGCICNSPTPPKNNCVRDDFVCPFDKNQLCTITTEDKSSKDNIINGYIYEQGTASEFKATIEQDKLCPGGYKWNAEKNICISPVEYSCLQSGFLYDSNLDECTSEIACIGNVVNGKCVEDAIANCPSGYSFNKFSLRCESNPICDKGIYNTISNLCEENISCPEGFNFSTANKRCEKLTSINRFQCDKGVLRDGTPNYCLTNPTIATPLYSGSVSKTWFVSALSLTNDLANLQNIVKDIIGIGRGTATFTKSGNNYIVTNTSKKPFTISVSTGGSVTVPANTNFTILPTGFQVGGTSLAGVNSVATFTISKACGSFTNVAATEEFPAYQVCNDISDKEASCSSGYVLGFNKGQAICYKPPVCDSGYILSENKMQCIKNLSCPAGYLADYSKNGCVKVEGGYELNIGQSVYVHDISCIGGISSRGACQTPSSCNLNGLLEVESDKCVLLPEYSCSSDKVAKCEEGYYFSNGTCLAIPTCTTGKYDINTGKCSVVADCPNGYFLGGEGKCLKQAETISYSCLSTETLYKGVEKDVCRIEKVAGVCKTGYTESLNASYCERDVICPAGYLVDNKNRTCVKGE